MHKSIILVGFWLATSAATVAVAQNGGPPSDPQRYAMKMEPPRTRAAAETRARATFAMLDRNKDGYITPDELRRPRNWGGGDGKSGSDRVFAMMDKDGNGQVSKAEFEAFRAERMQADGDQPHMAGGDMPQGHGAWRMHRRHDRMMAMMFRHADTNHDGRISLAEAVNAALKRFDRIDTNHDGVLSDAERDAAHTQFAMRMRHDGDWHRHDQGRYDGNWSHRRDAPPPAPSAAPQDTATN